MDELTGKQRTQRSTIPGERYDSPLTLDQSEAARLEIFAQLENCHLWWIYP